MQTVNGLMQPGRTAADKRNPAASTTRSWHIEFTPPSSALDQLGLLVQNRLPSGDDTLARFKQNIVPQLDAAYNFARFLSRDADAAQDIVQEAFLRAYRSFAGYRGGDARAWIFAIVRNCYHSWLEDRRRKSRLEFDPEGKGDSEEVILNISSDEDAPEAMLVRKAESQTVRFILNMLMALIANARRFSPESGRPSDENSPRPTGEPRTDISIFFATRGNNPRTSSVKSLSGFCWS